MVSTKSDVCLHFASASLHQCCVCCQLVQDRLGGENIVQAFKRHSLLSHFVHAYFSRSSPVINQ